MQWTLDSTSYFNSSVEESDDDTTVTFPKLSNNNAQSTPFADKSKTKRKLSTLFEDEDDTEIEDEVSTAGVAAEHDTEKSTFSKEISGHFSNKYTSRESHVKAWP